MSGPAGPDGERDARAAVRAPVERPVNVEVDTGVPYRPAMTANLSTTGMFVRTDSPPPVGAMVRFELELVAGESPVRGLGDVVWIRVQRPGGPTAGMGVRFRVLDDDARQALESVVTEALAGGVPTGGFREEDLAPPVRRPEPVPPEPLPPVPALPAPPVRDRLAGLGRRLGALLPRARPAATPPPRASSSAKGAPPVTGRQLAILGVLLLVLIFLLARM